MNSLLTMLAQSSPGGGPIQDLFGGLDQGQRFVVVLVAIGCATAMVISLGGIIAGTFNAVARRRADAEMKRELLDRGLTADEVARIIEAVPPPEDGLGRAVASWGCGRKK